jgi:hypothetical protein
MSAIYNGRSTFVTSQGYLGVGPAHAIDRDIVCIFLDAAVPFVFRELSRGPYQLVGECYVHGIMDGEFMVENRLTDVFDCY